MAGIVFAVKTLFFQQEKKANFLLRSAEWTNFIILHLQPPTKSVAEMKYLDVE